MRLLYLSSDPGIPVRGGKGASVHLRALTGALAELGHEVVICSPRVEAGQNPLSAGVRCEVIGIKGSGKVAGGDRRRNEEWPRAPRLFVQHC